MKKIFKRTISLLLVLVSIVTLFAGCGNDEKQVNAPELIPEQQIMSDKYSRNDDITNYVQFTMDYTKSRKDNGKTSINEKITAYPMSEHIKIQVDNWDSIAVGLDNLGSVVEEIEKRNKEYVEEQTAALIAERQKVIDEEYEAAKKEAEEKGKAYTKEKKTVRTDDIHFDDPYTYTVSIGTNKERQAEEYQETLLIDPAKNKHIILNVAKYGIPYVTITCAKTSNTYNEKITQESDWIITGISAADVSSYMYETEGKKKVLKETYPEFVDSDGLNKAAKKNIFMSGDISFGGGNFNWDSLMMFCEALKLQEDSKKHGYVQSSDKQFTYYTIIFAANAFERPGVTVSDDEVVIPWVKLVATFDPLSQVCINWTIDMSNSGTVLKNKVHTLSDVYETNVKDYQVDTNDYEGMREEIAEWIDANKSSYKIVYGAQESNSENNALFGVVETGNQNTTVEIIIDGTTYLALSGGEWVNGGSFGYYISFEKFQEAELAENENERNKILEKNRKALTIGCYVVDASNNIICAFDPKLSAFTAQDGLPMYLASYEESESGYRNAKILDADTADALILMYAKTYQLDENQTSVMYDKFSSGGLPGVKKYVDELFAEAEAAQKEKEANMYKDNEDTSAAKMGENTTDDLSVIVDGSNNYTLDSIEAKAFENGTKKKIFSLYSTLINIKGISYESSDGKHSFFVTDEKDGRNYVFGTNNENINFFAGIKAGMSSDELRELIGEDVYDNTNKVAVLKSKTHTLIATVTEGFVDYVIVIDNDYYDSSISMDKAISQVIMDELKSTNCYVSTMETNTTVNLSDVSINMVDYNFLEMSADTLTKAGFNSQSADSSFTNSNTTHFAIAGYAFKDKSKISVMTLPYNDKLQFIYTNNTTRSLAECEFYNGIKIGLSKNNLIDLLPPEYYVSEDGSIYIVKNKDLTLVICCTDVVSEIALIRNDTYTG